MTKKNDGSEKEGGEERKQKRHLGGVKGVGRRGKPSATLQQSIRD